MSNEKKTSDGVTILHKRYIKNDPERLRSLEEERAQPSMETILLGEFTYTLPGPAGGRRVEAVSIDVPPFSERYNEDGMINEIGKKACADAYALTDERRTAIEATGGTSIRWVEQRDNDL
jgi:hypothetical protein